MTDPATDTTPVTIEDLEFLLEVLISYAQEYPDNSGLLPVDVDDMLRCYAERLTEESRSELADDIEERAGGSPEWVAMAEFLRSLS